MRDGLAEVGLLQLTKCTIVDEEHTNSSGNANQPGTLPNLVSLGILIGE
jgi:hypothetical protein